MAVPDEPTHVVRAVAIAHGDLASRFRTVPLAGGLTEPLTDVSVPVPFAGLAGVPACFAFRPEQPASCSPAIPDHGPMVRATTYVGTYPPTFYLLVGWPSRLLSPRPSIYAMRLLAALIGAALLASGARSILESRRRDAAVLLSGLGLALTPATVFLLGSVNPNGLEIAAACGVWLGALAIADSDGPPTRRLLLRFLVALALMVGLRPLSPVLAVGIVALVAIGHLGAARARDLLRLRPVLLTAAVAVMAVTAAQLRAIVSHSSTAIITSRLVGTHDRWVFFHESLHQTREWGLQLVGRLGWLDTPLPSIVVGSWAAGAGLLVAYALVIGSWRARIGLVATCAAAVVLPVVAEMASGPTVGMGWQGRYGLPVAVGVPILSGWTISRSTRQHRAVAVTLGAVVAIVVGVGHLGAMVRLLNRYAVGLPSGVFSFVGAGRGTSPLSWEALGVAAMAVSALTFAWLVVPLAVDGTSAGGTDEPGVDDVELDLRVREGSGSRVGVG